MTTSRHFVVAVAAFAAAAAGCRSYESVRSAHASGDGTTAEYPAPASACFAAAVATMKSAEAATDEHPADGYVLGSIGGSFTSYGTVLGAWITPTGPSSCKVTAITMRKYAGQLTTDLTERTFQEKIAAALAKGNGSSSTPAAAAGAVAASSP